MMNKPLGKGLESLIPALDTSDVSASGVSTLPIDTIRANRYQPRKTFDPIKLNELAESIRQSGIIQPLIVTQNDSGAYELIAGERRLQAAKIAGLFEVPVVIRSVSKKEQFQLAIIENVQREDLSPMEEALAYKELSDMFELTHAQIAEIVGKDRATISNSIRLLKLSSKIHEMINSNEISAGHARAILSLEDEHQEAFAQYIVRYKLSVRQAEEKAKNFVQTLRSAERKDLAKDSISAYEKQIRSKLNTTVKIKDKGGRGKIELEYESREELEGLIRRFEKL